MLKFIAVWFNLNFIYLLILKEILLNASLILCSHNWSLKCENKIDKYEYICHYLSDFWKRKIVITSIIQIYIYSVLQNNLQSCDSTLFWRYFSSKSYWLPKNPIRLFFTSLMLILKYILNDKSKHFIKLFKQIKVDQNSRLNSYCWEDLKFRLISIL